MYDKRIPAGCRIHAPADMRDRVGLAIAPGGHVAAHQLRIKTFAGNVDDEVIFNRQRDCALQVAFERQVHVTRGHDQPAIDAARIRKTQAKTAWPVRDAAGSIGVAPAAAHTGAFKRDAQVGAGG